MAATAVTELINELAGQPGDVLLVLDDYHPIDAPPVHASVEFLLERGGRFGLMICP